MLKTMKNIIYSLGTLFLVLQFYSCSESFLDTVATDQYNEGNWWINESQVISTLNGCYAVLRDDQIGTTRHFREDNLTPNTYSFGGDSPTDVGQHDAGNDTRFKAKWAANYKGIGRANYFLDNVDKVQLNPELIKRLKGEALFLRAFYYSNLVKYFGGVPLILEAPDFSKQRSLPRNTRQEVLDQILTDLNTAGSYLPVSYSGADIGRATKGAALSLKARVLLYESRWSEAASAAKEVIDLNKYELFPDYRGLFMLENERNQEVIFSAQFKAPEFYNSFDVILVQQQNVVPTLDLVNSYLMIDGLTIDESPLYDPDNPYENRDPRLKKTIVLPGHMFRGIIRPEGFYYGTGFGLKKYTSYKDDVVRPDVVQSEIDYVFIRYADVLLMYAEARNEDSGPDASVYDAINQVRIRAGMPELPENLSKSEMRDLIRLERRIELVAESQYYHDIRRWKTAEVVMNATALNYKGEVVQTRKFNPQRDYLWPIHEETIIDNPALEQNPGY